MGAFHSLIRSTSMSFAKSPPEAGNGAASLCCAVRPLTRLISRLLLVLLLMAAVCPADRRSSPAPRLAARIEAQLARVAAYAAARGDNPQKLLQSLAELEALLPRSAATRRLQAIARAQYLAALSGRSPAAVYAFEQTRSAVIQAMRFDRDYQDAVRGIDMRLGFASAGAEQELAAPSDRAPRQYDGIPFDQMRPGDVMVWDDRSGPPMVRLGLALFAMRSTHSALFVGTTVRDGVTERWVYEAHSPQFGVRMARMERKKWMRPGLHVSLGHVAGVTPGQSAEAVRRCIETYGVRDKTPYHTWPPWDKRYDRAGIYCSQLIWVAYRPLGVDLDSNDWRFLSWFTVHNWWDPYAASTAYYGIFPDEIRTSSKIDWYYDQVNR